MAGDEGIFGRHDFVTFHDAAKRLERIRTDRDLVDPAFKAVLDEAHEAMMRVLSGMMRRS